MKFLIFYNNHLNEFVRLHMKMYSLNLPYKGVCMRFSPDCFLCMFNDQLKTNHLNV